MICALPFLMLVPPLPGVPLSVEDIVCRVAENQQRSLTARNSYVYDMNVFVRMKRANGKVAREETRDYVVVPGPRGAKRSLVSLEGRIFEGKTEIPYTNARYKHKGTDVDADITDSFAREIMWRRRSMGIYLDWFPLQKENAPKYTFRLEGEERYRGYDVYKLTYTKLRDDENDDCWSGEALIEKHEFQPVLITSSWSCKIPRAVTLLLGISVSQMGSKITYERFEKDLWFPSVSGGELKVRVLFLYARTIAFSAKNSNFRKTAVETNIAYETEENGEASVPLEVAPPPD